MDEHLLRHSHRKKFVEASLRAQRVAHAQAHTPLLAHVPNTPCNHSWCPSLHMRLLMLMHLACACLMVMQGGAQTWQGRSARSGRLRESARRMHTT